MRLLKAIVVLSLVGRFVVAQTGSIALPAGAKQVLALTGVGVQIYTCKAQAEGPAWVLLGPRAKLLDGAVEAGTHSAGPTWTLKDGSSVKGQLVAAQPSPAGDAIPWLLLKAAETKGPGALAEVKYIRRTETSGGKAESTGCDAAHLGATDEVPYKATYTFYVDAP